MSNSTYRVTPTRELKWISSVAVAAILMAAAAVAESASPPQRGADRMVVTRISQPITLDGLSNEPAWQQVPPLQMTMFLPVWGDAPSQRTVLLVAHDDDALYVAGRLYDREPDRIQANSKERDSGDASSDWFGVVIDTFNDKQNALSFFTTPAGLRWDATVQNDHEGPGRRNLDWNAFWDVVTTRTDEGWFAEMRIPFSTLRFEEQPDGRVVMGLIARRAIARNEEWDVYPKVPPTWGFSGLFKPSQAREIELRGIHSRRGLYVAPYTLTGKEWLDKTDGSSSVEEQYEVGLDVKYLLSTNFALDLTVNPDFAQVEADDLRFNLTRFPLFFPEKRPFFQERSSNLEFNFSGSDRVFYSRRIGFEDGQPVRIDAGVRVVGRAGPWDIGILDVQTASSDLGPSENSGVIRVRRQVVNENSYVGAILTSRVGRDSESNYVLGFDGSFRLFGQDYLTMKWAQSFDGSADQGSLNLDRTRAQIVWERRTIEGLGYDFRINHSGSDYEPDLGFQGRLGSTWAFGELRYGYLPEAPSSLYSHSIGLYAFGFRRQQDGELETGRIAVQWEFETRSGWRGRVSPRLSHEDLVEDFELAPGVVIPPGRHRYAWLKSEIGTPGGKALSADLTAQIGQFYDGDFLSLLLESTLRTGGSLDLSGAFEMTRGFFPNDRGDLDSRILRIRALYMFSTKLSMRAMAQYSNVEDTVGYNARLRFNPREGIDVWLVYNQTDVRNIHDLALDVTAQEGRSVMLKFCYTLVV